MSATKLITCITPKDGISVAKKLEEKGIATSNVYKSRGNSSDEDQAERLIDVLSVVVDEKLSEEIFEFLYNEFKMYKPHHGIIYQQTLKQVSDYRLPSKEEIDLLNKNK